MRTAAPAQDATLEATRQLIGRLGLGFVLIWFGAGELLQPVQWTGYIPGFLPSLPQVPMILAHGYVLFVVGVLVLIGQWTRPMAALAALILLSISATLIMNGGGTSLYIRDIGLLALSGMLVLEKHRALGLDAVWQRVERPRAAMR